MPPTGSLYEKVGFVLTGRFNGIDHTKIRKVKLSGNSYSLEVCTWIANSFLSKCTNLQVLDLSDIFTTRPRETLPPSLKILMDSVRGRGVRELYLSHNAFGPDGVESFQEFLSTC
eukprot:CAMPEP_0168623176 /NCGR_PEP_ID=MMETSP0449_2-20121227/8682_1 /TAXON_ID=1082188 /ORGANISM="Strombidium rassoulzadegani, Strain ras09" /LENGTH=114 /DNA_ID=CAMNT_0008664533 /DNA_START=114 /DNA_END=458 /DNA_ORIENTATION=-